MKVAIKTEHDMSGIYVETFIAGSIDEVWAKTQDPTCHQQWDLRFTKIEYLPHPDPALPQQFSYETRIGFGMCIKGMGETVGYYDDVVRSRSSALKFWSDDPKSLIRSGSGYWKYIPTADAIRFLTWYDYETRFGRFGQLFDAMVFRPLLAWATAWSFDRLRLWIEKGIDPTTINIAGIALSCIGFMVSPDLPSARRCLRIPRKDGQ